MNDDIKPVAWAIFRDGELDWEQDRPFSDEPQAMMDDEESRPLYDGEVIEQLQAEIERLREFERSAALTLPGVYYMDPPDGGDVSLLKQLQRSSIDAARYRLRAALERAHDVWETEAAGMRDEIERLRAERDAAESYSEWNSALEAAETVCIAVHGTTVTTHAANSVRNCIDAILSLKDVK